MLPPCGTALNKGAACSLLLGCVAGTTRDDKARLVALVTVLHSDDGPRTLALWAGLPKYRSASREIMELNKVCILRTRLQVTFREGGQDHGGPCRYHYPLRPLLAAVDAICRCSSDCVPLLTFCTLH